MDPRIKRTKNALIEAFLELLTEKEYHRISVSDITRKASVARPTFYLHYKSKQELLGEYFDSLFEKYLEEIQPILDQYDQNALSIALFVQVRKNEPYLRPLLNSDAAIFIQDKLHQYIKVIFKMLLQEQMGERSVSIPEDMQKFCIAAVAGTAYAVTVLWLEEGMRHDPEYMGKILYTISRPGILNLIQKEFE